MYVQSRQLPGPSCGDPFCLLANGVDSALFLFPTLLADFKDPIQDRAGSPPFGLSYTCLCPLYQFTLASK